MVSDEGGATDSAVTFDVQKLADRALDQLSLYEELTTFSKLTAFKVFLV